MRTSIAYRNAALDAELDPLVTLRIYSAGSGRPATADTAITDQVLLAEFTGVAWDAAAGGVKSLSAGIEDASANDTGTASWARGLTSGGAAVADFSVGTTGAEINLVTVSISAGASVPITDGSVTYPVGS